MSSLHKIEYVFKYSTARHVRIFCFYKSGNAKSCLSTEDLSAYKISWSHVNWRKFYIHLNSLKILPSPYSEGPLEKIIIKIKLVGMSTIFLCTNFLLNCNSS
jgi:hypothetical protein